MTQGRKSSVQPDVKERAAGSPQPPVPAIPPKKRGRPPKVRPGEEAPGSAQPGFGVSRPTAHRPLGLLEVQDPADLDALLADSKLASQIAMRLDERFALVLPAHLEWLQAALLKAGHTPKLSGSRTDSSSVGGPEASGSRPEKGTGR